jgi:hypothetical protein
MGGRSWHRCQKGLSDILFDTQTFRVDAISSRAVDTAGLLALLGSVGVSPSKRQLPRLLTDNPDIFITEARDVLRAALEASPWITVDDTGARHAEKNGFRTQIGSDWFTWFGTRFSKSCLNFLDLLHAGHTDNVLNNAA